MAMKVERFGCSLINVKFAPDGKDTGSFSGYGAVFGNTDAYGDVIAKGAFKQTLKDWKAKGRLPPMLLQHGGGMFGGAADDLVPIGKWDSMKEDDTGLHVEGSLFGLSTDRGTYIHEGMKAGVLDGMSIGYYPVTVKNGTKPNEPERTLLAVDLKEVSVVTFPANDAARVDAVKAENITERDFERWLTRDAGLSRSDAQVVINRGFKALKTMRDAGSEVGDDLRDLMARIRA